MRGVHPSKDITGSDGSELAGKKIVLCITGSVAAYRAIDMARLLMRRGADVHAVMSQSTASTLLHADMMEWATGNEVVTKLTGRLEHVALADYDMSDLVIVYPCTANTIGKAASGIDDTPVTSVLSVALGSKIPVIIAPTMHEAMYGNEFIQQNVERLKKRATFVEPTMEEGKAKVAEPEDMLRAAIAVLGKGGPLAGMKILISAGSTAEQIDPIRVITNASSGKMGAAIAREAEGMGAQVTLVYGHGTETPTASKVIRVGTGDEMRDAVLTELKKGPDVVIMAAAVADFKPASRSAKKLDTRSGGIKLPLVPTKKIVDEIKKMDRDVFLVAFKADYNVSDSALVDKAFNKLKECNADLVVANDLGRKGSAAGSDTAEVFIVDGKKRVSHIPESSKQQVASKLLNLVVQKLKHN
ncbi:bifunctional phosphopantothenoylcysteine decarboxylase/phosphopantothenate--cysteine ligase CoaBC [Nitrososphaera sp.]|uniref:bifunctional phosphopantothenoylcysteine decarboxylase/phosphopantothenate--cysteine ligase CoaBC n=1 Tax=Nitrososphaera sp. TaxID=1971748 RepID=UPI002ED96672